MYMYILLNSLLALPYYLHYIASTQATQSFSPDARTHNYRNTYFAAQQSKLPDVTIIADC